jgi:hypothetical protein
LHDWISVDAEVDSILRGGVQAGRSIKDVSAPPATIWPLARGSANNPSIITISL